MPAIEYAINGVERPGAPRAEWLAVGGEALKRDVHLRQHLGGLRSAPHPVLRGGATTLKRAVKRPRRATSLDIAQAVWRGHMLRRRNGEATAQQMRGDAMHVADRAGGIPTV